MEESDILSKLVGTLLAFLSGFLLWDKKRLNDRHVQLEARVRTLEQESMKEGKVRQIIADVVGPIKDTQVEIKADLKELLRISLERRAERRHDDD
jgi:hypothetical protein